MTHDPYVVRATGYRELVVELAEKCHAVHAAEIGVWRGDLSRMLAQVKTLETLRIIDSWVGHPENHDHVRQWAATMAKPQIVVQHEDSVVGATRVPPQGLDFVHIDGGHEYEQIRADLIAWIPKVRNGGILSGDNYEAESVRRAVSKQFNKVHVWGHGRIWWLEL